MDRRSLWAGIELLSVDTQSVLQGTVSARVDTESVQADKRSLLPDIVFPQADT